MNTRSIFIIIVLLAASAITAFAQEGQYLRAAALEGADDGPVSDEKREAARKKIESLRIWRLTEALKLDTTTSAKLASILSTLDQQKQNIQHEQMETMRSLRQVLKSLTPDQARLKTALESLEKNHRAMQELRNRELNDLKNILTVEQQARFIVFQQEFMREVRGMISDARKGGPGGGRMRGNPEQREN